MSSNASSRVRSRRCRYGLTSGLSTVVLPLLAIMTTFRRADEHTFIADQREASSSQLHTRPPHQAIDRAHASAVQLMGKHPDLGASGLDPRTQPSIGETTCALSCASKTVRDRP